MNGLFERQEWMRAAACRTMPTELFFPERGEDTRAAKSVCRGCPVRLRCAEFGAAEKFGIWGGQAERQRRRGRARRAAA